jgi:ribosome-associated protein
MGVEDDLRVTDRLTVPAAELQWRFSRSSGPGGQSVNTTDSRVELSFDLERSAAVADWQRTRAIERLGSRLVDGVVTIVSQQERSQLRNREAARARLAALLADAVAAPRDAPLKAGDPASAHREKGPRRDQATSRPSRRLADPP